MLAGGNTPARIAGMPLPKLQRRCRVMILSERHARKISSVLQKQLKLMSSYIVDGRPCRRQELRLTRHVILPQTPYLAVVNSTISPLHESPPPEVHSQARHEAGAALAAHVWPWYTSAGSASLMY